MKTKASVMGVLERTECFVFVVHQLFVEKKDRMLVRERVECSGDIFLLTFDCPACLFVIIYYHSHRLVSPQ